MLEINKSELTERDICTKYITPAVVAAGWDVMTQVREEVYFTKGSSYHTSQSRRFRRACPGRSDNCRLPTMPRKLWLSAARLVPAGATALSRLIGHLLLVESSLPTGASPTESLNSSQDSVVQPVGLG